MSASTSGKATGVWAERFRNRLQRTLDKRGMLRQDLAKTIGLSPAAITQNFAKPSEDFVRRVCIALPELEAEWRKYRQLLDGPLGAPTRPKELTPGQREKLVQIVQEMQQSLKRIERLLSK